MRVLIADEQEMFRTAMGGALAPLLGSETEILLCGSYAGARALLERDDKVDVAALDLFMPGFDDFAGLAALVRDFHAIPFLVLSDSAAPAHQREAIGRGARGFLAKAHSLETLALVLRLVAAGGSYLAISCLGSGAASDAIAASRPPERGARLSALTGRERAIVERMAGGLSNKEIARELGIAENSVKVHSRMIFRKLSVANRAQAAALLAALPSPDASHEVRPLRLVPQPTPASHCSGASEAPIPDAPSSAVTPTRRCLPRQVAAGMPRARSDQILSAGTYDHDRVA